MHTYTQEQIDALLERMPALMEYLRKRINDNVFNPEAQELFAALDAYCWHQPACAAGTICEGGRPVHVWRFR